MDDQSKDYDGSSTVKTDVPAIGVTFDQRLDDYRHLVFQTYVAADCKQSELNSALDKVRVAAERQKAIAHLPTLRGLLEDKEAALKAEAGKHLSFSAQKDAFHSRVGQMQKDSGRRGELKLSTSDAAEHARYDQGIQNAVSSIELLQKAIVVDKRNIEQAEKLIADGA